MNKHNTRNPYQYLQVTLQNHVVEVSLNRPQVKNALNAPFMQELVQVFDFIEDQAPVRAVFLTAQGTSFCAGADLTHMQHMAQANLEENQKDAALLYQVFEKVFLCSRPVVSFVRGSCFGGGLGLVAVSDYVIAAPTAQFCFSEVRLGLAPSVISTFIEQKGLTPFLQPEMLTARLFTSQEALLKGLVHQVQDESEWPQAQTYWQEQTRSLAPLAFSRSKAWLRGIRAKSPEERKAQAIQFIADLRAGAEGREGIQSFLEKRKASWGTIS